MEIRRLHAHSISDKFLSLPDDVSYLYRASDALAEAMCNCLLLDKGMAVNQALKENTMSLSCSIMGDQDTGIAQFIVDRPG